jgi:hypothetical protein
MSLFLCFVNCLRNSGGDINLAKALGQAIKRAGQVPGGACGYWGLCGAAAGAGIYFSIITDSNPLNEECWAAPQELVSRCLSINAKLGGVRCCKRTGYTAILEAVRYTREHLGVDIPVAKFYCTHSAKNKECLGSRCPYFYGR